MVQSTAKINFLKNQKGNLVITLAISSLILGGIAYWTKISSKIGEDIQGLYGQQISTLLRSDFKFTIKKLLEGTLSISECPVTVSKNIIKDKLHNFVYSTPLVPFEINDDPNTLQTDEVAGDTKTKCFFHPSRYGNGIKWNRLKVEFKRVSVPSLQEMASFITVDVKISYRLNEKNFSKTFNFKYRLGVFRLDRFGLIFTKSNAIPNNPLISLPNNETANNSYVRVHSTVLFDMPNPRSSNVDVDLSRFLSTDTKKLIYLNEVISSIKKFNIDDISSEFLTNKPLDSVFKKGIQYQALPTDSNFKMPYEINDSQWREIIDMKPAYEDAYPLPETSLIPFPSTSTPRSAIFGTTNNVIATFDRNNSYTKKNTYEVFGTIKPISQSCISNDPTSGRFQIYLFNHIDQDFTIDFTKPNSLPVFCGAIVAKNLTIKMNGLEPSDNNFNHHIIGKFILSGKITIVGKGALHIHDILEFTDDQMNYNISNFDSNKLRLQFYNQKFYSMQNFYLMVFAPDKYPTLSTNQLQEPNNNYRFYVPRSTRTFFNEVCGSYYRCRTNNIPSPDDWILNKWEDLVFEVRHVE